MKIFSKQLKEVYSQACEGVEKTSVSIQVQNKWKTNYYTLELQKNDSGICIVIKYKGKILDATTYIKSDNMLLHVLFNKIKGREIAGYAGWL
tara:strand:+ start:31 stop:306 length:276 start_codon:yes stop_codon:yes gene_type:complete